MKSKLLVLTALAVTFCLQSFGQPANDDPAGAIPITPSPIGSGCTSPAFFLPFSTDGTTDSGVQGSCTASGLDQFFTWTATTTGLFFSSQAPGNPGMVVWDADTLTEIACSDTFSDETLYGWNIGDDLLIQIYDFQGTSLSDVAFCLNLLNYTPPPAQPVTFTTQSSGSSGTYRLTVVDMNGDFLDDMVSVTSTNVNIREQNPGGGFTTRNISTSNADWLPSWSMAAADYDANGYTDLLYASGDGVTFMRANSTGTGFTEISTDISELDIFSQRSNFADIDNDGNLDAFVCHDVQPNVYFLNDGSGNLTQYQSNVTPGAPFNLGDYPSGGNYGSIWIDYDNDRDLDMFIAKCGGETARRTNQMHTNDGNGNYFENAAALNLADPMQTWSAAWGDFDNDGDMDVFVGASSGAHKLMRNNLIGTGTMDFTDITAGSGISVLTSNSIETVTFDFDNDGNLDLVSGGNILFGNGDMTFNVYTNVFGGSGAFGDLNNDGYIDAFNNGTLYLNNADTNNNWIKIHTVGVDSNIHGIGARVEVYSDSGVQIRDVKSGDGFRYMNSLNTHIGLGTDTTISKIVVHWPTSGCETFLNPSINQGVTLTEGTGVRCDAVVSPKVFLQGAAINPNTGEENLMRDNLRADGWLASNATTSPYADALVADASVFNTTGPDAIVDWVFVELRDENDSSIVLGSQSALLQRDGDIVGVDGSSPLVFSQLEGRSYVAVKHRNHLGLLSASPIALNDIKTDVDMASDPNEVEGQNNAVVVLSNGKYSTYAGDFDGNEQVQNADASGIIQLIGGSGYSNADMDANAQVQNSDVNALVNPNIGRGQQFSRLNNSAAGPTLPEITLTFDNAEITNDGTFNYYEADILISSTDDFYVGSGQVYFDYNTAAFGENISTSGAIEYSQPEGSILGYSFGQFSPAYKDFIQNDNTNSRVSLSFQQNLALVALETAPEIQVASAAKLLFHIKIRYIDAGLDADVCFYNEGVFQDQFFTACGGAGTADCTSSPGVQIFDDLYDCSAAVVETLGVSEVLADAIVLHPNPVNNTLYLSGNTDSINQIEIYGINGRLINTIESNFNKIDVSQLNTAVYLVKIQTDQGTTIKRLIKQ